MSLVEQNWVLLHLFNYLAFQIEITVWVVCHRENQLKYEIRASNYLFLTLYTEMLQYRLDPFDARALFRAKQYHMEFLGHVNKQLSKRREIAWCETNGSLRHTIRSQTRNAVARCEHSLKTGLGMKVKHRVYLGLPNHHPIVGHLASPTHTHSAVHGMRVVFKSQY